MNNINYRWLLLCFFLLCAGNASGWAIARKLAGLGESQEFLYVGGIVSMLIFIAQSAIFMSAKDRLAFQIVFRGLMGLSLVWYMLCLALPIFWIAGVDAAAKAAMAVFAVILFVGNGLKGLEKFKTRWREKAPVFAKHYNARSASLDWDKIMKSLHVSISVYVPGIPARFEPALAIIMVLSMILGLNLRKVFPVASVFAWGIPCIVVSSGIIQMIAINIAQALKVVELEDEVGARIRPVDS